MGNNSNTFEIRLKNDGKFFSRHYETGTAEQAAARAKGKGKILSVRKVHLMDIIGSLKSMNLDDVIRVRTERRQPDVILDGATLDSIIFPKLKESKRLRLKRQHLRKQREQNR